MQGELDQEGYAGQIEILGVNQAGHEAGNPSICAGRTLPWLQDTTTENVWALWAVQYRDVVILDAQNRKVAAYNLTAHNLADSASYEALKSMLVANAR